ncbi:T9SS type A sorting domain-containing protein [Adhaeribacter soli]|uniref:T9SS type A sorting domain-containing protein n=1 Tax=Adhaeribacter soli TaxID=2607655 RepID=A0A5N1J6Z0_9BACT|nr:T9SS type A sorting domain-containing protein [Adhaeribacter soli]KAA9340570.1 T9SS type A sorting domain-containing protein [Adhaeribacter soli]
MKKILLLFCALMAGSTLNTYATHDIGGDISFVEVTTNTYVVTYSHYNWAGLSGMSSPIHLQISAPGCNTGRSVPMQFQNEWVAGKVPTTSGLMPYKISVLQATVTFTAAEATCKDWLLSVATHRKGQQSANLTQTPNQLDIYTEATLKLDHTIYNGSSPMFDPMNAPVLIANINQPITLSVAAYDQDGDSLVYRMAAPLTGHNQPVTNYVSYNTSIVVNPNPLPPYNSTTNQQFAILPNAASTLSPHYPLVSYIAPWNTPDPATGIPPKIVNGNQYFILDSLTGALTFNPIISDSSGNNIYLASFQVDEFRRINGVATKIGSVRRETIIVVGDAGQNNNPTLTNTRLNNAPVQPNTILTVSPGSTLSLQVDADDLNAADSVYLKTNATTALQGATVTIGGAQRQTATITWTPTAAQVRSQPYYLRIWARDNASPFSGSRVETIALRVSNSGAVSGISSDKQLTSFLAFPNPSRGEVSFRVKAANMPQEIIIYNLQGREIDRILVKATSSGEEVVKWERSPQFATGTYLAKLISENKITQTLKFTKLQ